MPAQVLSIHAGHLHALGSGENGAEPVMALKSNAGHTMDESIAIMSPGKDETVRGRRRTRESGNGEGERDQSGEPDEAEGVGGPSRKRRRSRKGLDKKFECPHEGCGKSYSRAEHLYRHQLNHNPKQIYHCDFPDCHRSFVRQDLCARHKERHTARGSQLLRKDVFVHNLNPIVTAAINSQSAGRLAQAQDSPIGQPNDPSFASNGPYASGLMAEKGFVVQSPASIVASSATVGSDGSPPLDPKMQSPLSDPGAVRSVGLLNRSRSDETYGIHDGRNGFESNIPYPAAQFSGSQRHASFGSFGTAKPQVSGSEVYARHRLNSQSSVGSSNMHHPNFNTPSYGQMNSHYQPHSPGTFQSQHSFQPFSPLPTSGLSTLSPTSAPRDVEKNLTSVLPTAGQGPNGSRNSSIAEAEFIQGMTPSPSMPVFDVEGYNRSPFAMADDFAAWLFNDSQFGPNGSPIVPLAGGPMPNVAGSASIGLQSPFFGYDPQVSGSSAQQPAPPQHPMALNSIIETRLVESTLSEEKRQRILDLIEMRFNTRDHAPVPKKKDFFLDGNREDENHVLSLRMMQSYIYSYWIHFHSQLPILHRPTFNADACPELLLIAMMTLGASCMEKSHGYSLTQTCSELSNFLAWHLRWELFMDADFRPPAKLWIFQALLLLEIFEKMYSSRPMHERAHIHHATTLTLMRRGSSLIGRSPLDSPPSLKDGRKDGRSGAINASGANTPDEWWNRWITNEATRRAAFAAFIMDSIHATMFGHSAVMVAHEMRLPLPCDEALWSAPSSAEVARVESGLHANGIKPTTFLDGLKKTLNGQSVRTNSFGRTIIMAGLLSVSWHMNQRDLQVSSLGVVSQALGGRDKWRGSLTRAFDFWKRDFDESLASRTSDVAGQPSSSLSSSMYHPPHHHQQHYHTDHAMPPLDDETVFGSRTVLHHLAHMAMHVDIIDCQIFAGASRLLGRSITPQDAAGAQRRMRETWAPTARARDATFYALRFLSLVLMPNDHGMPPASREMGVGRGKEEGMREGEAMGKETGFEYSAREDFLLNRPWVLYFAALVVWSYGYALDGPVRPGYQVNTVEEKVADMQLFLRRVGGVRAPDDLAKITERNRCLGLLALLRETFRETRWELLHEASGLLGKCVEMLAPQGA